MLLYVHRFVPTVLWTFGNSKLREHQLLICPVLYGYANSILNKQIFFILFLIIFLVVCLLFVWGWFGKGGWQDNFLCQPAHPKWISKVKMFSCLSVTLYPVFFIHLSSALSSLAVFLSLSAFTRKEWTKSISNSTFVFVGSRQLAITKCIATK